MILLGITGPIGHGKTTLAQFLAQQEPEAYLAETSQIIAEVADRLNKFFFWEAPTEIDLNSVNRWLAHLPAIVEAVTHTHVDQSQVTLLEHIVNKNPDDYEKLWEYIHDARHNQALLSEHITPENKMAYRSLLQWLGGYLVTHVDAGIWYNELVRRAKTAETYGCKLFIIGGVRFPGDATIVRSAGGKVIRISRPGAVEMDKSDPTERERSNISADASILNNGDLDELLHCSVRLYHDLLNNKLKKTYRSVANAS